MRKKKWLVGLAVTMVIAAGCGSNSAAVPTPNQDSQQGEKTVSGTLSFYTSQPDEDAAALAKAFNQKYPDVKVETFRSGTEEVISKLQAENQAGKVEADVLLVADAVTFESLKSQQLLASYKSPEAEQIPASFVDPDGTYTGTKIMATVLMANSQKVKELPTSWKALTEATAKGQAVMPSPLYSGAAAYNLGVLTRTDGIGWEYYKGLQQNEIAVVKGNGAVLKSVAGGEKAYGMIVDYMAAREKAKGSPIDFVYPEEGVPVITEPIGILKNTDNETAAKAFVDFVLSEEGQKLAASLGYTPIRSGIEAPAGLKTFDQVKVLSADGKELLTSREQDKKEFGNIFGQ